MTIPKPVRDALGVGTGDHLVFVVEADGVRLRPIHGGGLAGLRGAIRGRAPFRGRGAERAAAQAEAARNALGEPPGQDG
ncbi:MAG: AbrB/MazE/SpoVT family DNA-binding domain-containing protein [Chloroflexi bacterium]|nr:AbrB/MazE/SpoVT family DNA-binding domain-containing protein [Chloroflexota bacterium]